MKQREIQWEDLVIEMSDRCRRERETYYLYRTRTGRHDNDWTLQSLSDRKAMKRLPEGEFIAEFFPPMSIYTEGGELITLTYKLAQGIESLASDTYVFLPLEEEEVGEGEGEEA